MGEPKTTEKVVNRYEGDPGLSWWTLMGVLEGYRIYCRQENINLEKLGQETVGDIIDFIHDKLAKDIEKFYFENFGGMRVKLRGEIGTEEWHDTVKRYYKYHKDIHGQNPTLDAIGLLEWLVKVSKDRKVDEVIKELRRRSD